MLFYAVLGFIVVFFIAFRLGLKRSPPVAIGSGIGFLFLAFICFKSTSKDYLLGAGFFLASVSMFVEAYRYRHS